MEIIYVLAVEGTGETVCLTVRARSEARADARAEKFREILQTDGASRISNPIGVRTETDINP
jgi:hypothetical protein